MNGRKALGLLAALVVLHAAMPALGSEPAGAPAATAPDKVTVNMKSLVFSPQIVMIKVNATVDWKNTESINHDVTPVDPGAFNESARNMGSGAAHSVKFQTAGVYDYYCTIHSTGRGQAMWGRVVVVDEPFLQLGGAGGEINPEIVGVTWLAHWVGIVSFLVVVLTLVVYYFVLKYGESVHTTDHRDRKEK